MLFEGRFCDGRPWSIAEQKIYFQIVSESTQNCSTFIFLCMFYFNMALCNSNTFDSLINAK